jgi:hypothetical protein
LIEGPLEIRALAYHMFEKVLGMFHDNPIGNRW